MSFAGTMATAVNAIQAQSAALGHIADNIANSSTTGFKRTDTSFSEVVTASGTNVHLPGSVSAVPAYTNSVQGVINSSQIDTHMSINGSGFFVVSDSLGSVDGNVVFDGTDYYTRRGDFSVDADGYLVNGGGYFLQGYSVDPVTGNTTGSQLNPIVVTQGFLAANGTTTVDYELNLPTVPETAVYDSGISGSDLLNYGTPYTNDPTAAGDGYVTAADEDSFLDRSISGGSITTYDDVGNAVDIQMRWAKTSDDNWEMFYMSDDTATGTGAKWTNAGQTYAFDSTGQLSPTISSITITAMTINGITIGDTVFDHGGGGVTQFANSQGNATVNTIDQNGYAAGELVGVSISNEGRVVGSYSNGETFDLAEIAVVDFNNADGLQKKDGTAYAATEESGAALIGGATGDIVGSSLEASNVDIADEFTKLIVTQQAYTAGTRIVTTADEMIKETLNMKR